MADLRGFAAKISARAQAVVDNVDALMRKVGLAVDSAVVLQTPVKTGRARANWQLKVGHEPSDQIKYPAPSKPASPGAGAAEAMFEAFQEVQTYNGQGELHITNNLPYIKKLNDGSSIQAPAGFVEKATLAAKSVVDKDGKLITEIRTETI